MLMPGETYPEGEGVYWVLDSTDSGAPLMLTDFELKALENGAPVSLTVTQMRADVLRLNSSGAWEQVGDANEFSARCKAVSANLFADLGDGKFMHHLVCAGDTPTSPVTTLEDALAWAMGGHEDPVGERLLRYREKDGSITSVPITRGNASEPQWAFWVDSETLSQLGTLAPDELISPDDFWNLQLGPASQVTLRKSWEANPAPPRIYLAYSVPLSEGYEVVVCASDYEGIDLVTFLDKDGEELAMEPDGRGPWFYSCTLPADYAFGEGPATERVEVTSVSGAIADQDVERIHTPSPQEPKVRRVSYDTDTQRLYANVEPGGNLQDDELLWVRVYHPSLAESGPTGGLKSGYVSMAPVTNAFEDKYGWDRKLTNLKTDGSMRVVAFTRGGVYTEVRLTNDVVVPPYASGRMFMMAYSGWIWWPFKWHRLLEDQEPYKSTGADMDLPGQDLARGVSKENPDSLTEGVWVKQIAEIDAGIDPTPLINAFPKADIYFRTPGRHTYALGVMTGGCQVLNAAGTGISRQEYIELTCRDILDMVDSGEFQTVEKPSGGKYAVEAEIEEPGAVFVFQTD
jgi:hypothetical protein